MLVKTRLDVSLSFRHALRVRPTCDRGSGCLPTMRFCRDIALLVAVFAVCLPLWAQEPAPIVRDIVVEYLGPPSISAERPGPTREAANIFSDRSTDTEISASAKGTRIRGKPEQSANPAHPQ